MAIEKQQSSKRFGGSDPEPEIHFSQFQTEFTEVEAHPKCSNVIILEYTQFRMNVAHISYY